jgi:hypothetical protein
MFVQDISGSFGCGVIASVLVQPNVSKCGFKEF